MFKITRTKDQKTWEVKDYKFVVFNEDGRGKELVNKPIEGSALILPPYNFEFEWMTSPITEIISETEFKTKNSHYIIEKL